MLLGVEKQAFCLESITPGLHTSTLCKTFLVFSLSRGGLCGIRSGMRMVIFASLIFHTTLSIVHATLTHSLWYLDWTAKCRAVGNWKVKVWSLFLGCFYFALFCCFLIIRWLRFWLLERNLQRYRLWLLGTPKAEQPEWFKKRLKKKCRIRKVISWLLEFTLQVGSSVTRCQKHWSTIQDLYSSRQMKKA